MRHLVLVLALFVSTSALAFDLDAFSKGLDPAAHARYEAAFIFNQIRRQQIHFERAVEEADPEKRRRRILELSDFTGWMAFHYGQAVVAHPRQNWGNFDGYRSCADAAESLTQLLYALNREMIGSGKGNRAAADRHADDYGFRLAECSVRLGVAVDEAGKFVEINLSDYVDGIDPGAHARFEAAFLFDQVQRQSAQIQTSGELTASVESRINLISEASHYASWMSFRYGRTTAAYPGRSREAFANYKPCSEAAYRLSAVGETIVSLLQGQDGKTNQDLHDAIELHQVELVSCSHVLGLEIR